MRLPLMACGVVFEVVWTAIRPIQQLGTVANVLQALFVVFVFVFFGIDGMDHLAKRAWLGALPELDWSDRLTIMLGLACCLLLWAAIRFRWELEPRISIEPETTFSSIYEGKKLGILYQIRVLNDGWRQIRNARVQFLGVWCWDVDEWRRHPEIPDGMLAWAKASGATGSTCDIDRFSTCNIAEFQPPYNGRCKITFATVGYGDTIQKVPAYIGPSYFRIQVFADNGRSKVVSLKLSKAPSDTKQFDDMPELNEREIFDNPDWELSKLDPDNGDLRSLGAPG